MEILEKIKAQYQAKTTQEVVLKMHIALQIADELGNNIEQIRTDFICLLEGCRSEAYNDTTGKKIIKGEKIDGCVTIGCGFNMSRTDAKKEWKIAGLKPNKFNKAFQGNISLSEKEIFALLSSSLKIRENRLKQLIEDWALLPSCVRIGLESIYYNSPKAFDSILLDVKRYSETLCTRSLSKACDQLIKYQHQNKTLHLALQKRRELEAIMMQGKDYAKCECKECFIDIIAQMVA